MIKQQLYLDDGNDHLTSVMPHFSIEKTSVILVENTFMTRVGPQSKPQ